MRVSQEVSDKISLHQQALLECCESINQVKEVMTEKFNISVMTILLTFDTALQPDKMRSLLQISEMFSENSKRPFSNQISIRDQSPDGQCCCKFFENGKVHVTGTKSFARAMVVVEKIFAKVALSTMLVDIKAEMLNTSFKLKKPLFLGKLCTVSEKNPELHVSYDSSRYPGVKLRLRGCGVMLVFSSGSVIFSGCKSPEDLSRLFRTLGTVLTNNPEVYNEEPDITHRRPSKKRKAECNYTCGYPQGLVDGIIGYNPEYPKKPK